MYILYIYYIYYIYITEKNTTIPHRSYGIGMLGCETAKQAIHPGHKVYQVTITLC